jgi:hypothetical protein
LVAKTPDQARATATPLPVSAPVVAGAEGTTGSQSDYTQFLSVVAKSPALITGYSKLLKAAGYYKGKITDKYTPALQNAFTRAEEDRLSISAVRPIGRDEFLQETVSLGGDGTGTGGPTTVTNVTKYKPEAARQLVDSIIKDTLGRKATAAEIKKYSAMLKSVEGKAASTTTYGKGANQTQTTMAGLNEQQYLVDQISGTDEGKANQVLGFYETFMNALGGGR